MTDLTKPTTLQEAINLHFGLKHLATTYAEQEKQARTWLADLLCAQEDEYKGKTITFPDGTKLVLKVTRDIKVDGANPVLAKLTEFVRDKDRDDMTLEHFNAFAKPKNTIEYKNSGYKSLPQYVKDAIAPAITHTETLQISYEAPKDER